MSEHASNRHNVLHHDDFPLSSNYAPDWVIENEMGPNVLWIAESLCQVMDLRPGMRVLDMGCGRALSSIFLAKEHGVQVWATDLWVGATDNWRRICAAGVEDQVFPIHAEARSLPYPDEFFDGIVSLDSYHYFGTDVHYLESHMLKLLKRGGRIGIVAPASPRDIPHPLPDHLDDKWHWLNSVAWWRQHWERYPEIEVELAEALPGGWEMWLRWHECLQASGKATRPEESVDELRQLQADGGQYLGFVRMVARRK